MVLEIETIRRRLKAEGYEAGANVLGSVATALYQEGLIPSTFKRESTVFPVENLNPNVIPLNGSKLKEMRKSQNLTQRGLASKAEVTPGWISQIERNKAYPSHDTADRLATALGVGVEEIIYQEQPKPQNQEV